jgi:cyclohexyl-isocyanide hydratase
MNRRAFTKYATAAAASALTCKASIAIAQEKATHPVATEADVQHSMTSARKDAPHRQIAMLLYPGAYPLDLIGPYTFLAGLMNADIQLVWKTLDPVAMAQKISLKPTVTFTQCPKDLDVIFVPGGVPGTIAMMEDIEVLDFLADRGSRARYVTSVCTGSLILGAAGLLRGYRATSHWNTRDILPLLGAIPVKQRIVEDRNRITGGGVTSGMDFGLLLASRMSDKTYAEMLQLINEYDPHPPFHAGTPAQAGAAITKHIDALLQSSHDGAKTAAL